MSSHDNASLPIFPLSHLERLLRKSCNEWSLDDLCSLITEHRIRLLSLMHIGGDGLLKALDFAPQSLSHLQDVLLGGERADGSSIFSGLGISSGASDIILKPKLHTAFLDPFSEIPTLAVLCSHLGRDGNPLEQSPDTVLNQAYERAQKQTGVDLWAHGEVEFFVGRDWTPGDRYGADDHGYHATTPVATGTALRRKALLILAEMGVPIKYAHTEVGYAKPSRKDDLVWEQHEVELFLEPLPRAAEGVALSRWVLSNLAQSFGVDCSFDPIIGKGHAGTGLHFHFSPIVEGKHRGCRDTNGEFYPPAKWLMAGLTQLGGASMAFGNRHEKSFVRLTQAKEAPNRVFWGEFDRRALIRLPIVVKTPNGRLLSPPTIEFRLPDGTAHAHLLLACVAQALTHGKSLKNVDTILQKTSVNSPSVHGSIVPTTFLEVADELQNQRDQLEAGDVFPKTMLDQFIRKLENNAD